jgi:hypothetical protein
MVESITFNTAESKLIVTLEDGTSKEYLPSDKDQYLIDYTDRGADIVAMGWNT